MMEGITEEGFLVPYLRASLCGCIAISAVWNSDRHQLPGRFSSGWKTGEDVRQCPGSFITRGEGFVGQTFLRRRLNVSLGQKLAVTCFINGPFAASNSGSSSKSTIFYSPQN